MAKGQLRGNREAKKPKQAKAKVSLAPDTLTARLNGGKGKAARSKN
ncbi:hypothetical protein FHS89_000603 [Rubricella aquisinus]|uniref:Uncharacterized protein n=1 Tax=Rubricella aquisinus TaxID=2028108 RepID=A0A840WY61_9RHOB|nr:hypothetical protein [Rubricella aquisinus]MBB5514605.1 hypothetical protein [Rubricella aquisinus]